MLHSPFTASAHERNRYDGDQKSQDQHARESKDNEQIVQVVFRRAVGIISSFVLRVWGNALVNIVVYSGHHGISRTCALGRSASLAAEVMRQKREGD
jgi:hypothetical protein